MTTSNTPVGKTERLMNVVMCLLATSRPLTKAEIQRAVEQYHAAPNQEAFDRMFERDKSELRDLGIPVLTTALPGAFDDEEGYRIPQAEFRLPPVKFSAPELAVMGLATRAWSQAGMAGAAARGLHKLSVDNQSTVDTAVEDRIRPHIGRGEIALQPLLRAHLARNEVSFDYRSAKGAAQTRHMQPWGLVLWRGRWYVIGWDTDKQAERVFRLSRIAGVPQILTDTSFEIPPGFDARSKVQVADPPRDPLPAILSLRRGRGGALRRRARTIGSIDPQWDAIDIDYEHTAAFAAEVASYGADVIVQAPDELRSAVVSLLQGASESKVAAPRKAPIAGAANTDTSPLQPTKNPRAGGESASDRLQRLLTMVPWLSARQGVSVTLAAEQLGVSESRLLADLGLLFLCGYGTMPDELIDVDVADGRIYLTNAETLAGPLRLSLEEAAALLVALRALSASNGVVDATIIDSLIVKLEEASGFVGAAAISVAPEGRSSALEPLVVQLREALGRGKRVHLRYLVSSRDEVTERDVDLISLTTLDGHLYAEGWCHRAQAVRLFRVDRIEALTLLEQHSDTIAWSEPRTSAFQADNSDPAVTIWVDEQAAWVAEYYPNEAVVSEAASGALITLRVADVQWLLRLMLSLGSHAQVTDPVGLADRVYQAAQDGLSAYSQPI